MLKKIKNNGMSSIYLFGFKILSYRNKTVRKQNQMHKNYEKKAKDFNDYGVRINSDRSPKIIVSLTSYPLRMEYIHLCLYSLLTQSLKPDMLILWLSPDDFPNKEKDLPKKVVKLQENGLTIKWCSNIKSYKKLIPALKEFPNDIIITTDDDVIYSRSMVKKLYQSYLKSPNNIHAHWITKLTYDSRWHADSQKHYAKASFLNQLTGVGGVLYPPNSLHLDVLNENLFMKLAPTNDDQWFWCQAIRNNTKTQIVKSYEQNMTYIKNSQNIGLWKVNVDADGPKLFWRDFEHLMKHYPELEKKLFYEIENNN